MDVAQTSSKNLNVLTYVFKTPMNNITRKGIHLKNVSKEETDLFSSSGNSFLFKC